MGEGRFTRVRFGIPVLLLLVAPHFVRGQERPSASDLVRKFENETVFWRQFEIAKAIVAAGDTTVLSQLEPWLTNEDRSLRGNAAFIFARMGDRRGFDAIVAILNDYSESRAIHAISSAGGPSPWAQIRQDRYYAAHLLGDLKDPRAVPVLAGLLDDADVNYVVPWSLTQIADRSAITPLMALLNNQDPSIRVLAIHALAELNATDALPRLRMLLDDPARSHVDNEPVADAAKSAIAQLESGKR